MKKVLIPLFRDIDVLSFLLSCVLILLILSLSVCFHVRMYLSACTDRMSDLYIVEIRHHVVPSCRTRNGRRGIGLRLISNRMEVS